MRQSYDCALTPKPGGRTSSREVSHLTTITPVTTPGAAWAEGAR